MRRWKQCIHVRMSSMQEWNEVRCVAEKNRLLEPESRGVVPNMSYGRMIYVHCLNLLKYFRRS